MDLSSHASCGRIYCPFRLRHREGDNPAILMRFSTWKSTSVLRGFSEKTVREVHSRSGGVFR